MTHEERRDMAAVFGIDYRTVLRLFNKVTARTKRGGRSIAILVRLFDPSRTMRDIASELEVTPQRVSQVYRAALEAGIPGLPRRRAGRPRRRAAT